MDPGSGFGTVFCAADYSETDLTQFNKWLPDSSAASSFQVLPRVQEIRQGFRNWAKENRKKGATVYLFHNGYEERKDENGNEAPDMREVVTYVLSLAREAARSPQGVEMTAGSGPEDEGTGHLRGYCFNPQNSNRSRLDDDTISFKWKATQKDTLKSFVDAVTSDFQDRMGRGGGGTGRQTSRQFPTVVSQAVSSAMTILPGTSQASNPEGDQMKEADGDVLMKDIDDVQTREKEILAQRLCGMLLDPHFQTDI